MMDTLPPEILVRIASHLTTPELGCFRLTCKHVEEGLWESFVREFFRKRQFMIEHNSLQALVAIANHTELAKSLTEVIIGLHSLPNDIDLWSAEGEHYYREGYVSRQTLAETGQAHAMLVEAFSKLPNLKKVGLRDYNAAGRTRDNCRWRSYGWSMGADPPLRAELERGVSTNVDGDADATFSALLYALGCANARPQSIEVILRHTYLAPSAFNVLDGFMAPAVMPVLTGLTRLLLTVARKCTYDNRKGYGPPYANDYDETSDYSGASIKRFLHHTFGLQTLRINSSDDMQFYAHRILHWLGQPALTSLPYSGGLRLQLPIPPVTLDSLTGLDLGKLNVSVAALLNVVTKFKTLTSLNLWRVVLHCDNTAEYHSPPDRWSHFASELSVALSSDTSLEHVFIGDPSQCYYSKNYAPENRRQRIYFAKDGNGENTKLSNSLDKVSYGAKYSGGGSVKDWDGGVKEWLSKLSKATTTQRLPDDYKWIQSVATDDGDSLDSDEEEDLIEEDLDEEDSDDEDMDSMGDSDA